jgi:hypothetical protein
MRHASALGFTRSAGGRLGAAVIYVVIAVGLVYVVQMRLTPDHERAAAASATRRPPVGEDHTAHLTLVATYAVERWTVQAAGKDLPAQATSQATSAQEWHGDLHTNEQSIDVFIHAEPHDPLTSGACAVRAILSTSSGMTTSRIVWGEGSVAAQLSFPLVVPAAAGGTIP